MSTYNIDGWIISNYNFVNNRTYFMHSEYMYIARIGIPYLNETQKR